MQEQENLLTHSSMEIHQTRKDRQLSWFGMDHQDKTACSRIHPTIRTASIQSMEPTKVSATATPRTCPRSRPSLGQCARMSSHAHAHTHTIIPTKDNRLCSSHGRPAASLKLGLAPWSDAFFDAQLRTPSNQPKVLSSRPWAVLLSPHTALTRLLVGLLRMPGLTRRPLAVSVAVLCVPLGSPEEANGFHHCGAWSLGCG